MNLKEQFLAIGTYEEYCKNKPLFKELDFNDDEIGAHYIELLLESGAPRSDPFEVNGVHTDYIDFRIPPRDPF